MEKEEKEWRSRREKRKIKEKLNKKEEWRKGKDKRENIEGE